MNLNKAFAMRVSNLLIERKMSKYQLEKRSGLTHSALRYIFNEVNSDVKFSTIVKVVAALDMTLEEFFEVLTLKQLGRHNPAIAILNTNGFYDKMQEFVLSAVEQRFIRPACLDIYALCPTPAETLAYLERYDPAALDVRHLKNI